MRDEVLRSAAILVGLLALGLALIGLGRLATESPALAITGALGLLAVGSLAAAVWRNDRLTGGRHATRRAGRPGPEERDGEEGDASSAGDRAAAPVEPLEPAAVFEPFEPPELAGGGSAGRPGNERFEALVRAALDDLPPSFAARLGNVSINIADDPDREALANVEPGHLLLGLYRGVPQTQLGAADAAGSTITIYRRPLELVYPEPEALEEAVRIVVLHEIGHYFGLSDARLDELQRDRWAALRDRPPGGVGPQHRSDGSAGGFGPGGS